MWRTERALSIARRDRFRSLPLAAVLCALLLLVQGAAVAHDHDDDPGKRYDCDICLKIGSSTDAISSSHPDSLAPPMRHAWRDLEAAPVFPRFPDLHARAPPRA